MKYSSLIKTTIAAALIALTVPAQAAITISEVSPYSSGNSVYGKDWFELTNTGASAVNISGWKVDDNSNAFASSLGLRGVPSIAAGQSVVFIESDATGSTDAAVNSAFVSAWFGSSAPLGLAIGNYGGSGIGLSTAGDAVNIFDGSGTVVTRVDFVASTTGRTFDNAAGLNNVSLTQLSSLGVNGAFNSVTALTSGVPVGTLDIGSPGSIAAVPEPETYALLLSGLALIGSIARRRKFA